MTKDMVSREKRGEREVMRKIFWVIGKGTDRRGQEFHPCIKIEERREVGRERWTSTPGSPHSPAGLGSSPDTGSADEPSLAEASHQKPLETSL